MKKQEWDKNTTPKEGTSAKMQMALDWWHDLPIQNLQNMNESMVGYLWKYFPNKDHPYHLTGEEVQMIYENEIEFRNNIRREAQDFLESKGFKTLSQSFIDYTVEFWLTEFAIQQIQNNKKVNN